jgi:hypothetical protein
MSTAPANTTDIKWYAARFYYKANTSDTTKFCDVAPANSDYQDLIIGDRADIATTLVSGKVTGLENEIPYRMVMATVDDAQNVQFFSDPTTYLNDNEHKVTPTEVIGLLDGKKCFIATAAYGSAMDSHVEVLRNFRDTFLLQSGYGKRFVEFYYENSPALAHYISHKEGLRLLVRTILWPVVGFAKISLEFGMGVAIAIGFLILIGLVIFSRTITRKMKRSSLYRGLTS